MTLLTDMIIIAKIERKVHPSYASGYNLRFALPLSALLAAPRTPHAAPFRTTNQTERTLAGQEEARPCPRRHIAEGRAAASRAAGYWQGQRGSRPPSCSKSLPI